MAVGGTAELVALYRALESLEPRARLRDPFASAFLSRPLALAVRAARSARCCGKGRRWC